MGVCALYVLRLRKRCG